MRKFTQKWQRKGCLLFLLVAMSESSFSAPLPAPDKVIIKPVAWQITGKVTTRGGEPLPGVTVVVKGTTNGTATGVDGSYALSVPENAGTLVFSFIGYTNQEKAFNGPGAYNVTLLEDAKALEEVVVVGYGTQRKSDVTGATATVQAKDLNAGVINNPLQAVQGKVAGLNIVAGGGDPNPAAFVSSRADRRAVDTGGGVDDQQGRPRRRRAAGPRPGLFSAWACDRESESAPLSSTRSMRLLRAATPREVVRRGGAGAVHCSRAGCSVGE